MLWFWREHLAGEICTKEGKHGTGYLWLVKIIEGKFVEENNENLKD